VTGWIDPILISGAWARKRVGKPETAVVAPAAAETLRKVRRFIFFIQNPSFQWFGTSNVFPDRMHHTKRFVNRILFDRSVEKTMRFEALYEKKNRRWDDPQEFFVDKKIDYGRSLVD
jgi:hypothetical protein